MSFHRRSTDKAYLTLCFLTQIQITFMAPLYSMIKCKIKLKVFGKATVLPELLAHQCALNHAWFQVSVHAAYLMRLPKNYSKTCITSKLSKIQRFGLSQFR